MLRVGIVGFGFMGKMHLRCYRGIDGVTVAAVCDADQSRLKDTKGAAGNVGGAETPPDLTDVNLHTDFDGMLAEEKLDAVSITLPTSMHRDFTVKALDAGVNVLCEKPMAVDIPQCKNMIAAARKSGRILQIGHCIRFWPEYAKTKELVDAGVYGKIRAASFRRLSTLPKWSWNNWLMDASKSGGALMDLHIHDSDFVQYLFGMPKAVRTSGAKLSGGGFDHVATQYIYDNEQVVTAEGGWIMSPAFGFEMSFNIVLEKATIVFDCTRQPAFKIFPAEGEPFTPPLQAGDGYSLEIAHFIKAVNGQTVPEIITPAQSLDSIRIVLAEKQSAQSGKEVKIK